MTTFSRAEWGAEPPKRPGTPWRAGQPSSKTAHYEGSDFVYFGKGPDEYAAIVRGIQHYHMHVSSEGYQDIAYNFVVSPLGDVYEGRGVNVQSGAQASGNSLSLAVCYIGGPNNDFTGEAQTAFGALGQFVSGPWRPHSSWLPTGCPGNNIRWWIDHGAPAAQPCACPPAPAPAPPPDMGGVVRYVRAAAKANLENQNGRHVLLRVQAPAHMTVSEDVKWWQHALNSTSNANLVADGRFGKATLGKTTDFQRFFGLGVDGIVGNRTRSAMIAVLAKLLA